MVKPHRNVLRHERGPDRCRRANRGRIDDTRPGIGGKKWAKQDELLSFAPDVHDIDVDVLALARLTDDKGLAKTELLENVLLDRLRGRSGQRKDRGASELFRRAPQRQERG